jgi:hypothetical protein
MSPRRLEHGTPDGYARGCTQHAKCPALPVHGLTCETAHIRFESGERRYMNLYGRNMPAAAIARRLGFAPPKPTVDAIAPEDEYPIAAAPDVEEAIARYAARKEAQERDAATTKEPTVTTEPTPPVCPECVAGKHPNCDGRAWDDVADAATTCACIDSTHTREPAEEQAPETEEPTMTEPTEPTDSTETPAADAPAPEIPSQSVIRAWARANGIEVNPRGSVQKGVVNAYLFAHRTPTEPVTEPAPPTEAEPAADVAALVPDGLQLPEYLAGAVEPAAIAHSAEAEDPERFIPIGDFGRNSDMLDETRRRLGMEDHPSSWVPSHEIVPGGITITRPDWADVAVSHDVEQARSIAARLEAENAILLADIDTHGRSLEFALRQWAAAADLAADAERRRAATVRFGLARLRAARERENALRAENATLDADLVAARTQLAALAVQLEQAQTDAAAPKQRRFFGGAR